MIFGQNPPQISYLGLPSEMANKKANVDSCSDLISIISKVASFNLSLDIKIVCIDISEISLSQNVFESAIDEESKELSEQIIKTNSILSKNGIRVCLFVGKEYFLGSQLEEAKASTIRLLNRLSEIMDLLGVNYPSIFIRIGSAYGNRKGTMSDFCKRLKSLHESVLPKLSVMNDDKPSLFSITDLLSGIYYNSGIPITFRILAHQFNDGGLTIREALFLASSTWKTKPIFFHSESLESDENGIPLSTTTSEYLTRRIPTFGLDLDVVIDSPNREDSCLKYRMDYKSLPPIIINKPQ